MVAFLGGVFTLLFAGPFVIERRLAGRVPDRDARWERALLIWGGSAPVSSCSHSSSAPPPDFSGGSLAGSASLMVAIAAGLVEATLVVWLLSG